MAPLADKKTVNRSWLSQRILDHQHAHAAQGTVGLGAPLDLDGIEAFQINHRGARGHFDRDARDERAAFAERAFGQFKPAAIASVNSASAPDPNGAAELARRRVVGLRKRLKEIGALLVRYPAARVGHGDRQNVRVETHADFDATGVGEFDRVADDVAQDLAQARRVRDHPFGHGVAKVSVKKMPCRAP